MSAFSTDGDVAVMASSDSSGSVRSESGRQSALRSSAPPASDPGHGQDLYEHIIAPVSPRAAIANYGHGSASHSGHDVASDAGHGSASDAGHGSMFFGGYGSASHAGHGSASHAGHGSMSFGGYGPASHAGHGSASHSGHGSGSQSGHGAMRRSDTQFRTRARAMDIMARHVFEEGCKQRLICRPSSEAVAWHEDVSQYISGVALRIAKHSYASWPRDRPELAPWLTALSIFNVGAAMTLRTTATEGIIDMLPEGAQQVILSASSRIQVLQHAAELSIARKAQGAAFIREARCVIVWSDTAEELLPSAEATHARILNYLWGVVSTPADHVEPMSGSYFDASGAPPLPFEAQNLGTSMSPGASVAGDHSGSSAPHTPRSPLHSQHAHGSAAILASGGSSMHAPLNDNEKAEAQEQGHEAYEERPTVLIAPVLHGLAFSLALVMSLLQTREALELAALDGGYIRLAVAAAVPVFFIVVMFFSDMIFGGLFMLFGSVRQLKSNTRYYSGTKPKPLLAHEAPRLPRITVHMPVYKESIEGVLKPSFESIKKAVRTYELQGGSASMIVSEDGMNIVDETERNLRRDYYEENNITWIARPKHNDEGFVRNGRFKKASNLNFTYEIMNRVEERMRIECPHLSAIMEGTAQTENGMSSGSLADEAAYRENYNRILQDVLAGVHPRACGSGVDRMGDLVLLVDSDTRIPEDCFLDAATEMVRSKDVGVLQFCSGVMMVSDSFFEKLIGNFTKVINFSISYTVANGDVAPFMGHNAYLRWTAMKEVAKTQYNADGSLKSYCIWSEDHVSEDFVMALDLIDKGYITRWATYADGGYEEGVSLSCTDELNRWQKYAWGVSEITFNKIWQWVYRGPTSPLFNRFIFGKAPAHYKWAALSYCFSYYSIGSALPATLAVTLVSGWIGPDAQVPFLDTLQVLIAVLVVFLGLGTTGLAIVRFRAGLMTLWQSIWFQLKLVPFSLCFFGGLSYHCLTALLAHPLGFNMSWGATLKDIELHGFYKELPDLLRHFWRMFIICIAVIAGIAVLMTDVVPLEWRLFNAAHVFPLFFIFGLHVLYPFILNPNFVRFSF